jgi:molecular chaperone IbpA
MFSLLDEAEGTGGPVPGYPPYNIERTGENAFRISVAVAGFTDADLAIEVKENTLTVRGEKQASDKQAETDILYQGIAARGFVRTFRLADHVGVTEASLENGLLNIALLRTVPEAMKRRAIPITNASKVVNEAPVALAA